MLNKPCRLSSPRSKPYFVEGLATVNEEFLLPLSIICDVLVVTTHGSYSAGVQVRFGDPGNSSGKSMTP